jgi:hypothetical protein
VADAFASNLVERNEVGAACAVYVNGRPVVDIWGGHRDAARTLPWERDTMIPVFSATKVMTSVAMAVAHGRGVHVRRERCRRTRVGRDLVARIVLCRSPKGRWRVESSMTSAGQVGHSSRE